MARFPTLAVFQFHARQFVRINSVLTLAAGCSLVPLVTGLAIFLNGSKALSEADQARNALPPAVVTHAALPHDVELTPSLRHFHSAEVVQALNDAAGATDMVLSEITFSLEDSPAQPYIRYRWWP